MRENRSPQISRENHRKWEWERGRITGKMQAKRHSNSIKVDASWWWCTSKLNRPACNFGVCTRPYSSFIVSCSGKNVFIVRIHCFRSSLVLRVEFLFFIEFFLRLFWEFSDWWVAYGLGSDELMVFGNLVILETIFWIMVKFYHFFIDFFRYFWNNCENYLILLRTNKST